MRRFLVVLLSLGLIMAFSTSVFATDAKFNGEFKMQGWYNKNASLIEKEYTGASSVTDRGSSAFYTQRLRMGMTFDVVPGLKFVTRFDALERKWMAARTDIPADYGTGTTQDSEAENISFEIAYVQFSTPIGLFLVGNTIAGQFGTPFNDYVGYDNPIIAWVVPKGPWTISAAYKKSQDGMYTPATATTPVVKTEIGQGTDNDADSYTLKAQYKWNTGGAGIQLTDVFSNTASDRYKINIPFAVLYAMNRFGKIYVEDEVMFILGGKFQDYVDSINSAGTPDVDNEFALSNYFNINIDLAPAKVGLMFIYSPGDDTTTKDKKEGGYHAALKNDRSFNPALILFNNDYVKWMGKIKGNNTTVIDTYFDNVLFYQVYGQFALTPKLNLGASFSYATAEWTPAGVDDEYGYEVDLTMKYKIFDNLEYMIGAGFLSTGDYFKGTESAAKVDDNYLITHKLTLTF
ncbi:MAG: hypothetical protein JXA41_16075 [Deltaproteobacteria bacterium]|nr:hypothetical protein [Deltaproteobacteria bacterium]